MGERVGIIWATHKVFFINLDVFKTTTRRLPNCQETVIENISQICLSCMVYTKYAIGNIKLTKKIS